VSAGFIVDLGNTAQLEPSIIDDTGFATPASGVIVGQVVDFLQANVFTNLFVGVGPNLSGPCKVLVQTADVTTSGSFTDPTSGLPAMPTAFQSGGIFWAGSGGNAASGVWQAAGFQSPHRYGRAIVMSGDLTNSLVTAGFIKQRRTTGSGAGFTYSPGSGSVSV
jgi:hypothetical protein